MIQFSIIFLFSSICLSAFCPVFCFSPFKPGRDFTWCNLNKAKSLHYPQYPGCDTQIFPSQDQKPFCYNFSGFKTLHKTIFFLNFILPGTLGSSLHVALNQGKPTTHYHLISSISVTVGRISNKMLWINGAEVNLKENSTFLFGQLKCLAVVQR